MLKESGSAGGMDIKVLLGIHLVQGTCRCPRHWMAPQYKRKPLGYCSATPAAGPHPTVRSTRVSPIFWFCSQGCHGGASWAEESIKGCHLPSDKQLLIRRESKDRETHGAAISNVPGLCTYHPSMYPTVWKSSPAVLELCPTWSGTKIQAQKHLKCWGGDMVPQTGSKRKGSCLWGAGVWPSFCRVWGSWQSLAATWELRWHCPCFCSQLTGGA